MVRIEHIAEVLKRYDNWTDRDETAICKLLEVDHHKAGVSPARGQQIDQWNVPGPPAHPIFGTGDYVHFFAELTLKCVSYLKNDPIHRPSRDDLTNNFSVWCGRFAVRSARRLTFPPLATTL